MCSSRIRSRSRQQAYVKSPTTHYYDAFGSSVAIDGDNVAIGAPKAPIKKAYGRAFLVQRQGSTWAHRGFFRGSDTPMARDSARFRTLGLQRCPAAESRHKAAPAALSRAAFGRLSRHADGADTKG